MTTSHVKLKDIRFDLAARRISLVDLYAFLRESDASSAASHLQKLSKGAGASCSNLKHALDKRFSFLQGDNKKGKPSVAVGSNLQLRLCLLDIWNTLLQSKCTKQRTIKSKETFLRQYHVLQKQFNSAFGSVWDDEVPDLPDLDASPLPTSCTQRVHVNHVACSNRPSSTVSAHPSSPENIGMTTPTPSNNVTGDSHAHSSSTPASNIHCSTEDYSISDQGIATSESQKTSKPRGEYSALRTQHIAKFGSEPATHGIALLKQQISKVETTPLELGENTVHQIQQACLMVPTSPMEPMELSRASVNIICSHLGVEQLVDSIGVHTNSQYSLRRTRTYKSGDIYMKYHCKFNTSFGMVPKSKDKVDLLPNPLSADTTEGLGGLAAESTFGLRSQIPRPQPKVYMPFLLLHQLTSMYLILVIIINCRML